MAEDLVLTLPFRGKRDYLLGAEVLLAIYDQIPALSQSGALRFSVHDMLSSNQMRLQPCDVTELIAFPSRLVVETSQGRKGFGLAPEKSSITPERSKDHEPTIKQDMVLTGDTDARFVGAMPMHPLSVAVALKKFLMQQRFRELTGKWTFCRLDAPAPLPDQAQEVRVRYSRGARNIHASSILMDGKQVAEMTFMNS